METKALDVCPSPFPDGASSVHRNLAIELAPHTVFTSNTIYKHIMPVAVTLAKADKAIQAVLPTGSRK